MWALVLCSAAALAACRGSAPAETEVEIRNVGFDSVTRSPVVVLQDHDRKIALPIWIGATEAQAIAAHLEGIAPPRPMTHDLIKAMLEQAGIEFQRVVIQALRESTYIATIHLRNGRRDLQIDSRPSDAIALAVRFHRPIFVATGLLKGESTIDLQRVAPVEATLTVAGVTVQNLTDELAEYFGLPRGTGVLVAAVDSDAAEDLRRGDVILELDGQVVSGVGDFDSRLRALAGGATRLSVQRGAERVQVRFTPRLG
jgi:uncharacterized protein